MFAVDDILGISNTIKKWIDAQNQFEFYELFFDIKKMTKKDVYIFIYENNFDTFKVTLKKLVENEWKINQSYYDNFVELYGKENEYLELVDNIKALNVFKNVVKCILYYNLDINSNKITDLNQDFDEKQIYNTFSVNKTSKKIYFRGQSNSEWGLTPTILRNFPKSKQDGIILNLPSMYKLYKESLLIDKYNTRFPGYEINEYKDLNYDFLSMMQHSISYSPLIDFTSDYNVAISFAIRRNNPTDYLLRKSAIYIIMVEDNSIISTLDEVNNEIQNLNISYLKEKIIPGKIYKLIDFDEKIYELDFRKIENIIKELKPDFFIVDSPRNDRMRNQKGKFILFNNYTSVNGNLMYTLNKKLIVRKHIISRKSKDMLIGKLDEKSLFIKYSYLMNPYQIFED